MLSWQTIFVLTFHKGYFNTCLIHFSVDRRKTKHYFWSDGLRRTDLHINISHVDWQVTLTGASRLKTKWSTTVFHNRYMILVGTPTVTVCLIFSSHTVDLYKQWIYYTKKCKISDFFITHPLLSSLPHGKGSVIEHHISELPVTPVNTHGSVKRCTFCFEFFLLETINAVSLPVRSCDFLFLSPSHKWVWMQTEPELKDKHLHVFPPLVQIWNTAMCVVAEKNETHAGLWK